MALPLHHKGVLRDWFPMQLTHSTRCNLKAKVGALIEEGRWVGPKILTRDAPDITHLIEGVDITGGEDSILWAPASTSEFTVANTNEYLRRKKTP